MTERARSVDPVEARVAILVSRGKKYGGFRPNSRSDLSLSALLLRGRVYWSPSPRSWLPRLVTVGGSTVESEMRQEGRLSALSYGTFDSIAASR